LPQSSELVKDKIRQAFKKNRDLRDKTVAEMLFLKTDADLEECLIHWKPKHNVLQFAAQVDPDVLDLMPEGPEKELLSKFFNPDPNGWDRYDRFV